MRLQEIYHICKTTLEEWPELNFIEKKAPSGSTYYQIANSPEIISLLSTLDCIPSFSENIASVRNTSIGFKQGGSEITFDSRGKNLLISEYKDLKLRVLTIAELFLSLNYTQNTNGFDIKLPINISLSDLSKCTKDLNTIFSTCPLITRENGSINFVSVDVGSVWLNFIIGGLSIGIILEAVASLVDKAIIIRSHYLTAKEQEEKIRTLKLGNDALETAQNTNKEIGKALMTKVCNELASDNNLSDPEDLERLRNCIQLLSDWMIKGMEIYPAIQIESETKAVFPPLEQQMLSEHAVSLLTSGHDDTEKQ